MISNNIVVMKEFIKEYFTAMHSFEYISALIILNIKIKLWLNFRWKYDQEKKIIFKLMYISVLANLWFLPENMARVLS